MNRDEDCKYYKSGKGAKRGELVWQPHPALAANPKQVNPIVQAELG